jgi:hypothetical protein
VQAKPFIARAGGRPSEEEKNMVAVQASGNVQHNSYLCLPFCTTKDAALLFLAGLDKGSVLQICRKSRVSLRCFFSVRAKNYAAVWLKKISRSFFCVL